MAPMKQNAKISIFSDKIIPSPIHLPKNVIELRKHFTEVVEFRREGSS